VRTVSKAPRISSASDTRHCLDTCQVRFRDLLRRRPSRMICVVSTSLLIAAQVTATQELIDEAMRSGTLAAEEVADLVAPLAGFGQTQAARESYRLEPNKFDFWTHVIGHVSGLIALAMLAAIAWRAVTAGDATQGASIICTGAVSIVAVFVSDRLRRLCAICHTTL
jgi:hypothetical protein